MNASLPTGRLLVGLTVVALLGGCASGASPTMTPTSASPSSAAATPASTGPATASPATTLSVVVTRKFTYESTNPELTPDVLDVYAPAKAGPWPVVVMFHGAPGGSPAMRKAPSCNARATRCEPGRPMRVNDAGASTSRRWSVPFTSPGAMFCSRSNK